jgi:hypothetical protein
MFVMVTGDQLILGIRRIAIYRITFLSLMASLMVILHFQPPYLQYWQIPCYIFSFCVSSVTYCTFSGIVRSLFRAATLLNNCFKVRKSRPLIYGKIHSIICVFIPWSLLYLYFSWKVTLFKFFFSRHDLLRSAFKWRIIANYLGKSNMYRVCQKVWRMLPNTG